MLGCLRAAAEVLAGENKLSLIMTFGLYLSPVFLNRENGNPSSMGPFKKVISH